MKKFCIEHIGIMVNHPVEMGAWYRDVLGFDIQFSADNGADGVAFVRDNNKVMVEFGKVPNVEALKDRMNHHLQLHIALTSDDPDADADYLIEKGAKLIEKCAFTRPGDYLLALEDPWGHCIQLARRSPDSPLL